MKAFERARRALVVAACAALSQVAWAAAPSYSVQVVREEGGLQFAQGLNNRGWVAMDIGGADGANYRCTTKKCITIPSLPNERGVPYSYPEGINDQGLVVGSTYTGKVAHAMVFDGQTVRDLGTFDEDDCGGCKLSSTAWGINRHGHVAGDSDTADNSFQACVWRDSTITKLPTLGGTRSSAMDINDAGDAVGFAELANETSHAVLYRDGVAHDLGTLRNGLSSQAYAINNLGQVVGESDTDQPKKLHVAFIYDDASGMREIPSLGGWGQMSAHAINDQGWVVGHAVGNDHQAGFVYDGQATYDLNGRIGKKNKRLWQIYRALEINEKGQILVQAQSLKDFSYKVLLLSPL
jgi:probable HAF family extracellular repeat protein